MKTEILIQSNESRGRGGCGSEIKKKKNICMLPGKPLLLFYLKSSISTTRIFNLVEAL